jgi:hypothetical protein
MRRAPRTEPLLTGQGKLPERIVYAKKYRLVTPVGLTEEMDFAGESFLFDFFHLDTTTN